MESEKKYEFLFGTSMSGCDSNDPNDDTGALLCVYEGMPIDGSIMTAKAWHDELMEDY